MRIPPNYTDLAFAGKMGNQLKALVEEQLSADLIHYGINKSRLKFDWSESCIEGHCADYLDGSVENFSGISVYDDGDNFVAEGWMEFIYDEIAGYFISYWEFVRTYDNQKLLAIKEKSGIPEHIYLQLPKELQDKL